MNRYSRRNRIYIGHLTHASVFRGCTDHELRAIASFSTPVDVEAGRVLTEQGAPGFEMFVVLAGQAVVERDTQMIGNVVEGSIIGEIAVLLRTPRTATVTAATDMTLLVISRSEAGAMRSLGIGMSVFDRLEATIDERLAAIERTAGSVPASDAPTARGHMALVR